MPRVAKRKYQKVRPVVEYNEEGVAYGQANSEMQSYIGVLARSRVPLVDKKWAQIPKDIKEQIWEAVDMAFVVGKGGKKMVLSSAAKKWKDFKSTLTRQHILPFIKQQERLRQPPELYKFIERAEWDSFVASRLSDKFESVHNEQSQRREKLEYNHRLSRKGYAGLKDQLQENMPGVKIDRSTLWKKAREDKSGNIPDPKVAEKAKLIDELQKKVSEGTLTVSGGQDVLTLALGPDHPGRVRGVGAGISPSQYFNTPRQPRLKFADQLKESVRLVLQEETLKMEARAREEDLKREARSKEEDLKREARSREEALRLEARTKQLVQAERENLLSQLSQLIPNFDPSLLNKLKNSPIQVQGQEQSPLNPMSDKASCSGALDGRALLFDEDSDKNGKNHDEENIQVVDYSKLEVPSPLQTLCRYVETTMKPEEKALCFTIEKEVFGEDRSTFILHEDITQFSAMEEIGATVVAVYMRCLFDHLKAANMLNMVGFIDPALVSANAGSLSDRSRLVARRLQRTDGEQIFLMPYNQGRHWVLFIVRAKKETIYFLDPLPGNRVVNDEAKNILNSAIKMYNSHIGRQGRKATIWKTLPGTPKQPSSVECGYYVMRFMRDIIMDTTLDFEKMFAKGNDQHPYPQAAIDVVRKEWADFVCLQME